MNESSWAGSPVSDALDEVEAAYARFTALCLDPCADDEVVDLWRRHETLRRSMAAGEFPIIHQVDRRGLAFKHGCKSVRDLARTCCGYAPATRKRGSTPRGCWPGAR